MAQTPANSRNRPSDAKRRRFAAALAEQLSVGTRPNGPNTPWSYEEFANEVDSPRLHNDKASPRSVSNWCQGKSLPTKIGPILEVLFGQDQRNMVERSNLLKLFREAEKEKAAETLKRTKRNPAGAIWVVVDDQLAIDKSTALSDLRIAKDELQRKMQAEVGEIATKIAEEIRPNDNSKLMWKLAATTTVLAGILSQDPKKTLENLFRAYRLSLELGIFLDVDLANQQTDADAPLSPDMRGQLVLLVRSIAPWLRKFPTVARWDNENRQFQGAPDLFDPALALIQVARKLGVISAEDAADVVLMLTAAFNPDEKRRTLGLQAEKAARISIGDTINLLLAAAGRAAAAQIGVTADDAGEVRLIQRIFEMFIAAEQHVKDFAATMEPDLRHALLSVIEEIKRPPEPAISKVVESDYQEGQGFIQDAARDLVIRGGEIPPKVKFFTQHLDLSRVRSVNLGKIADFRSLETLILSHAYVSGWAALAQHASLLELVASHSNIEDLSPLSRLVALQRLRLQHTAVSDLSALVGLTSLKEINLTATRVTDLAPLSQLSSLNVLDLSSTPVSNLSPLAGSTALKELILDGTKVRDLSALAGLTSLTRLSLRSTEVTDISALADLKSLTSLNLSGNRVSDISALAGLSSLRTVDLSLTKVMDVSPLVGLLGLRVLSLSNTPVGDVSPLASLTSLAELYLSRTLVSDVSLLAGLTSLRILLD